MLGGAVPAAAHALTRDRTGQRLVLHSHRSALCDLMDTASERHSESQGEKRNLRGLTAGLGSGCAERGHSARPAAGWWSLLGCVFGSSLKSPPFRCRFGSFLGPSLSQKCLLPYLTGSGEQEIACLPARATALGLVPKPTEAPFPAGSTALATTLILPGSCGRIPEQHFPAGWALLERDRCQEVTGQGSDPEVPLLLAARL